VLRDWLVNAAPQHATWETDKILSVHTMLERGEVMGMGVTLRGLMGLDEFQWTR
jgi:hypothetical protein